jgi:hypothetical protein
MQSRFTRHAGVAGALHGRWALAVLLGMLCLSCLFGLTLPERDCYFRTLAGGTLAACRLVGLAGLAVGRA